MRRNTTSGSERSVLCIAGAKVKNELEVPRSMLMTCLE